MHIREISIKEFDNFADNNKFSNFHQTINYAILRAEDGYEYDIIGYEDDGIIKAASIILYKPIADVYYGYAPQGFLIDYSDTGLLRSFTNELKEYYKDKDFAFIKINPEIAISKLNYETGNFEYNDNYSLINTLTSLDYKKLKNNMNFESLLPRVNAIINLDNLNPESISKNTRNKVRKGLRKGLTLELASLDKLPILYNFIKSKDSKDLEYYKNLYSIFDKNNSIDLLLVKVNFKDFLLNTQEQYNEELEINNHYNELLLNRNNNTSLINKKMSSDKTLLSYKNDIAEAAKYINTTNEMYVAGALVIKHKNKITIKISGFDKSLSRYSPNYYLYFSILAYYKNKYKLADLNGVTGDLSKDGKYYGLNRFKLGFNPNVYEYIGEFDLIINEKYYNGLLKLGLLAKEFNKNKD